MKIPILLRSIRSKFAQSADACVLIRKLLESESHDLYRLSPLDSGVEVEVIADKPFSRLDYAVFRHFNFLCYLEVMTSSKYSFSGPRGSQCITLGTDKFEDALKRLKKGFNCIFVYYLPLDESEPLNRFYFTSVQDILSVRALCIEGSNYDSIYLKTPLTIWHCGLKQLIAKLDSIPEASCIIKDPDFNV